MSKKVLFAGLCVAALSLSPLVAAPAKKSGSNFADAGKELGTEGKAIDQLGLAYKLADYARSKKDGHVMLIAAKMVGDVTIKPGADQGSIKGAGTASASTGSAKVKSAADLYGEARKLAVGNNELLEEIQNAQSSATKGAVGGAIGTARYVPSNTIWSVGFTARGGEPLLVGAQRDASTPIDLKIYDEYGNLVCQDNSHDVVVTCRVTPAWTGRFRVDLVNHGNYGSAVALLTN